MCYVWSIKVSTFSESVMIPILIVLLRICFIPLNYNDNADNYSTMTLSNIIAAEFSKRTILIIVSYNTGTRYIYYKRGLANVRRCYSMYLFYFAGILKYLASNANRICIIMGIICLKHT